QPLWRRLLSESFAIFLPAFFRHLGFVRSRLDSLTAEVAARPTMDPPFHPELHFAFDNRARFGDSDVNDRFGGHVPRFHPKFDLRDQFFGDFHQSVPVGASLLLELTAAWADVVDPRFRHLDSLFARFDNLFENLLLLLVRLGNQMMLPADRGE